MTISESPEVVKFIGIGIDYLKYSKTTGEGMLDGCTKDMLKMYQSLVDEYEGKYIFDSVFFSDVLKDGNDDSSIMSFLNELITNAPNHEIIYPSNANITNTLGDLASQSRESTITKYILYYSGHGSYVTNWNRLDGDTEKYDQTFVFLNDLGTNIAVMLDDTMVKLMQQFSPKVNITSIIDCCHSGTIMDIPSISKDTIGGPTLSCISACNDEQTSALTSVGSVFTNMYMQYMTSADNDMINAKSLYDMANEVNIQVSDAYDRYPSANVKQTSKVTTNIVDGLPGLFGKITGVARIIAETVDVMESSNNPIATSTSVLVTRPPSNALPIATQSMPSWDDTMTIVNVITATAASLIALAVEAMELIFTKSFVECWPV
jgi:hypothetical protein